MSLLDTFVQVFVFDTRQADAAFKHVQRSTDDIIDGMKQAQHEADKAAKSVSDFASGTETSVAALAQKTLGVLGILLGVSSIFSESVSRAEEVEALDKLGKKINVATADVDAFAGSVAELGGRGKALRLICRQWQKPLAAPRTQWKKFSLQQIK